MKTRAKAKRPSAAQSKAPTRALSPREREVLEMLVEGNTNKFIAIKLKLSVKTVEKHRQTLMKKLDIHHITGLTRYAIAAGITEMPSPINIV